MKENAAVYLLVLGMAGSRIIKPIRIGPGQVRPGGERERERLRAIRLYVIRLDLHPKPNAQPNTVQAN